ncbi:hypothetical protein K3G63_14235 [Hymenobacter sp. HSC-4F20]|uniref:hypothetical protein n=1 Tax=Hymenobacter sp. HSC-4F20 TaxID=2864135 RepID=UPI001C72F137|nr:hypothetical protein [Hymenobacter sp. HSC-4F20]MBX0291605.1 hypothetical protein [Hymenobacter sp. HSC-4F20]
MPTYSLPLLVLAGVSVSSVSSYGQGAASDKQTVSKIAEPLYIINSHIIGNGLVAQLNPADITKVVVYKPGSTPGSVGTLASTGILALSYTGWVASRSFAKIGRMHGVRRPFRVVLNGTPLNDEQIATLRIAPQAIGRLQVTPATSETAETTISIQLAEAPTSSQSRPPGSIMIR